ncbi:nitroreductase family protein [Lacticaseibacillus absianus]|uniref:nitroreductase family protein n=1 Tax=Lacticaseibacillus absianus TaxID=2729623 RepID=UPI0015CEBD5E|nr:nitroreductase family protein [Lacticaseibacillus absianus]
MDTHALQHRSIRRFKPVAIDYRALETVAQATSSSEFLQSFTMIRVTTPRLRAAIAAISGSQVLAQPNGELFIFVVDTARAIRLTAAGSDLHTLTNWNAFLAGAFDATLAAQNVLVSAERAGLGGVLLGSILNDPQQMIDLLRLPRYTFPLLGLIVGVPAEAPAAKPRLPQSLVVSENAYPAPDDAAMARYDDVVAAYYAGRGDAARQSSFTSLVQRHLGADQKHRDEIGQILRQQGFVLD